MSKNFRLMKKYPPKNDSGLWDRTFLPPQLWPTFTFHYALDTFWLKSLSLSPSANITLLVYSHLLCLAIRPEIVLQLFCLRHMMKMFLSITCHLYLSTVSSLVSLKDSLPVLAESLLLFKGRNFWDFVCIKLSLTFNLHLLGMVRLVKLVRRHQSASKLKVTNSLKSVLWELLL